MTLDQLINRLQVLDAGMTRKDDYVRVSVKHVDGIPSEVTDAIREHQKILVMLCRIVERGPIEQNYPRSLVSQKHRAFLNEKSKAKYAEYLQTDHWKEVRKATLERAGYKCQMCSGYKGLQVHHNNYWHLGHETKEDTVALCRSCHKKYHDIDE